MDLALLQMPMVLFTTLVPMASGAFVGLALAFLTSRFSKERLARIDRWTLLPMAILAVGYIASFVALSSPQYSMSLFQGVDIAPLSFVGIAGMLFIALAVVYWIIAMTGNLDGRPRKVFATVVGAASLLLSLSIGVMYMGSAVLTWNSPLVPLGIIGFCIAGGVPLGVLVVALAGGMPEARLTRLPTVALFTAFIGVVAAIVAVSAQLLFAQSTFNAFFPGSDVLPGSWVYLVISIVGFVVMLATLRATLMPGGRNVAAMGRTAGAAAAIPLRDREDVDADAPVGVRSAIPLLVAGNAAVLIGIFVARLMFYALQV